MQIEESSALSQMLGELAHENPHQIAWIRVIAADGHVIASSGGDEGPTYNGSNLIATLEQHRARNWEAHEGAVLLTLNPFPLRPPDATPARGPEFIEVALYRSGISVHFGPLRQDLIVGFSAAFALLGTVVLIRLRFADYLRAKQIEKELAVARRVQCDLFPAANSVATDVAFAARCVQAWEVGGDLYDVFTTDRGEAAFVLGDVSGKGLSAALIMGVVQGAVRASSVGPALSFQDAAAQLNRLLCAKTARERFVTLFWCIFDARAGILRYVNAGHCPPILIRATGEILRLEAGGPVLGVLSAARYEYGELAVEPGDLLVIYSDGIVEAADAHDEEFGDERLISAIEQAHTKEPAEICDNILSNVKEFLAGEAPQDDQTLVIACLEPTEIRENDSHLSIVTKTAA